jgi:hypothetical protein
MKVEGQCHCGQIAYEAEVDPEKVSICHCTDCQVLTGTAYRLSVPAAAADFHLKAGKLKTYLKTTADSGNPRLQAFCPNCGTPIYASAPEKPTAYTLRVGAIRQRDKLPPKRQIWCRSALSWSSSLSGLPSSEREAR